MYIFQCLVVCLALSAAVLNGSAKGSEISDYYHSTVKVKGSLKENGGTWLVDNKIQVSAENVALNGGYIEIIGFLYAGDQKPLLYPLQVKFIASAKFSIEKYIEPLEVKGKKATIIAQHPISGSNPRFDYFDGPFGQMVVYFDLEKDQAVYSLLSPSAEITLVGTFRPVFVHSKRPGGSEERIFYGFQMDVVEVK